MPALAEGIVVTMFIIVRSVARSRTSTRRVLGGTVVLEEEPVHRKLSNSWILMNPGGPPTPDKPGISVVNYEPGDTTSIFLNLRVADIQACYKEWKSKGAEFVTPPIIREAEIRCYMRDPDGYMIEVGQATGALHGHLAEKRPEDLRLTFSGVREVQAVRGCLCTRRAESNGEPMVRVRFGRALYSTIRGSGLKPARKLADVSVVISRSMSSSWL